MALLLTLLAFAAQDEPAGARTDLKLGRLFVPEGFKAGEKVDVHVHFHGSAKVVEREFVKAKRGGVLVTVHVGAGSAVYEKALADPETFPALLEEAVSKAGGTKRGAVRLSSFSAGYGAIRRILQSGKVEPAGLLLADSLHAGYDAEKRPRAEQMEAFVAFAKSGKPLRVTHSAIVPGEYASTTETADVLIAAVEGKREARDERNARGMRLVSKAEKGGLQVFGYEGTAAAAHMDHLHNLGEWLALLP